jgi:xylose dehydrogenase (NAD/NADP)
MTGKVKWGVLGYARIAKNAAMPAILASENSELWAVASGDAAKRQECNELFNCPRVYERYEEVLADPEVQAVYIPLPNSLHKEWAIRAMESGKHVLCEKPMALTAEECEEMVGAADKHGVLLMEAFMYRYTDRTKQVQAALASGEIGDVRYVQSTFRFFLDREGTIKMRPELGGGSLYDVGVYPINFVGMVTNELPASCAVETAMQNGVDVLMSAVLRYPSGIVATINSGFNAFSQMNSEIVGTKGRIEVTDTFAGSPGAIRIVTASGSRDIPVEESDRYTLEVTDFADAILQGRQPLLGLPESLRNMRVIDMLLARMNDSKH